MESKVLSLVSRSNQDGISKLSAVSELAETIITDRNCKEQNNKNNQKELPQLKNYFNSKLKQNSEQKVLENKKHRLSREKSFNLFPSKTLIQILHVCILHNVKPCQTQPILVFSYNQCLNHPKILTSQKLGIPLYLFGFKSFDGFVNLVGRIKSISYFVKMLENVYRKPHQTWQAAVRTFKNIKMLQKITKKEGNLIS